MEEEIGCFQKCKSCRRIHSNMNSLYCQSCIESSKKIICQTCNVIYDIYIDHQYYNTYVHGGHITFCNACLSRSVCSLCAKNDEDDKMILCDGCDFDITSITCLKCAGLSEVPKGPWLCHMCVQSKKKQTRVKRARAVDVLKVERYHTELIKVKDELVQQRKKREDLVDTHQRECFNLKTAIDMGSFTIEGCNKIIMGAGRIKTLRDQIAELRVRNIIPALEKTIDEYQQKN